MFGPQAGGVGADCDGGAVCLVGGDALVDPAVNGAATDTDAYSEGLDCWRLSFGGEGLEREPGGGRAAHVAISSVLLVAGWGVARLSR